LTPRLEPRLLHGLALADRRAPVLLGSEDQGVAELAELRIHDDERLADLFDDRVRHGH
jgi:hypothetical protein